MPSKTIINVERRILEIIATPLLVARPGKFQTSTNPSIIGVNEIPNGSNMVDKVPGEGMSALVSRPDSLRIARLAPGAIWHPDSRSASSSPFYITTS